MYRHVPVVGLVGGVGSGKSAIAHLLKARLPVEIIDADAIGHRVLQEPAIIEQIQARFGSDVLHGGKVDRRRLARHVFGTASDARQSRADLEALVHPRIRELALEQIEAARRQPEIMAILLDAAILLESGWKDMCDCVVFVDTPRASRARRVADNRGWSDSELQSREDSQWPLERKRMDADAVIDNSGAALVARDQLAAIALRYAARPAPCDPLDSHLE